MKVSISKLRADHLSKLASSSVSLGELHQLTTKSNKTQNTIGEVDPELLQSIKDKLLKKPSNTIELKHVNLEDDKCALIFTSHQITNLDDRFKTKQYIDMVKESYYNFRKATLYEQRLQDLQYAINEGLSQEFGLPPGKGAIKVEEEPLTKGAHAVFKELFFDNQLDSYSQDFMSHISNLQ